MFSLNVPPKYSFGSNYNPRQHLMWHQQICFYILITLFTHNSMLQSSEKFSLLLRQSFIAQHWMKGEGDCRTVSFVLATIVGLKIKTSFYENLRIWILILLILLILNLLIVWNWRKFWVNLGKNTKWPISLANFHFGYLKEKVLVSSKCFIFTHFVNNRNFWQCWIKIINDPLELKIAIFVLISQITVFHFVHKKYVWQILVKFTFYKVSL